MVPLSVYSKLSGKKYVEQLLMVKILSFLSILKVHIFSVIKLRIYQEEDFVHFENLKQSEHS